MKTTDTERRRAPFIRRGGVALACGALVTTTVLPAAANPARPVPAATSRPALDRADRPRATICRTTVAMKVFVLLPIGRPVRRSARPARAVMT